MKVRTIGKMLFYASLFAGYIILGISYGAFSWQYWAVGFCVLLSNIGGMLQEYGSERSE